MNTLTDEQCEEFRRLPGSFNDMVRAIYEAGMVANQAKLGIAVYALEQIAPYWNIDGVKPLYPYEEIAAKALNQIKES